MSHMHETQVGIESWPFLTRNSNLIRLTLNSNSNRAGDLAAARRNESPSAINKNKGDELHSASSRSVKQIKTLNKDSHWPPRIVESRNVSFQRYPQPGASLGVEGSIEETASLGGHLMIDGICHGVTTHHITHDRSNENVILTHLSQQDVALSSEKEKACLPLGVIVAQSGVRSRTTSSGNREMDWTVFRIDQWPFELERNLPYGHLSSVVRDFQPGIGVYAIGRTSGRQLGKISSSEMTVLHGDRITSEWCVIRPDGMSSDDWVERGLGVDGDGGSWILDDNTNAVYGMVWGRSGKGPDTATLFMPMRELIEDIKERIGAREVHLPLPLTSKDNEGIADDEAAHLDDKDIVDIESVQDSVFSNELSIGSSQSSISETTSASILSMLTKDSKLQALYKEGLAKISSQRFVENLRRLLIQYSQELKKKASDPTEIQAAGFLRFKSRWLATQISLQFGPIDEETRHAMEALMHQDPDKTLQLEQYLAEQKEKSHPVAENSSDDGSDRERNSSDGELDVEFINIKQIQRFLEDGEAFLNLKEKLHQFLHPVGKQGHGSDQNISTEDEPGAGPMQEGSLPVDLPHRYIPWYQRAWSGYASSVANELRSGFLYRALTKWSIFPTQEGIYTHVKWKCICGEHISIDIKCLKASGADNLVRDLTQQAEMGGSRIQIQDSSSSAIQTPSLEPTSNDSQPPSVRRDSDSVDEIAATAGQFSGSRPEANTRRFILLCADSQAHDTRLAQIEITKTINDYQLMQQIRQAYFTLRACRTDRFTLLHPTSVQLVKFEVVTHVPPVRK